MQINFSILIVFPHSNFALFNLFFFSIAIKYFRTVVVLVYLFVSLKINLYWIGTKKISPVPTSILCLGSFFFCAQLNQFIVWTCTCTFILFGKKFLLYGLIKDLYVFEKKFTIFFFFLKFFPRILTKINVNLLCPLGKKWPCTLSI